MVFAAMVELLQLLWGTEWYALQPTASVIGCQEWGLFGGALMPGQARRLEVVQASIIA